MEIDLLQNYPKAKRNLEERSNAKTDEDRAIARQFGYEFFDGDRRHGYGGFTYQERFWTPVVPDFVSRYAIRPGFRILDVGCAKGFMLYDFKRLVPGIEVAGVDISDYAIVNAKPEVSEFLDVANATSLPYDDNSFDLVISINTIHNLDEGDCERALREISRVSKGGAFITVDAFNTEEERDRMYAWNLTAKTIMSTDDWKLFFKQCDYKGDYFWFIP